MVDARQSPVTGAPAPDRDIQEQFSDFFRGHYRRVVQLVILMDGTVQEAEDAAMHAFQDAYAHWRSIRSPAAWVRTAARRKFIKDRTRDRDRQQRAVLFFRQPDDDEPLPPEEDLLVQWQELDWVNKVLDCLPSTQRKVMACIVDGMSTAEIADLLGKNETNVRSHLRHARKRLQERLSTASSYVGPAASSTPAPAAATPPAPTSSPSASSPSASSHSASSHSAPHACPAVAPPRRPPEQEQTPPPAGDATAQAQPGSRKGETT
ncbi:RNA polymerase sigma factor [Actinomadura rupiterrae]|uniref:RNA polymerase sigma factor n=1 Tax=Actinomadura rupiterrae TaxID=559627 RepID=UPI0026464A00|nr:RNA polymerase sigma factor [Actinomadura rupiterrae]MCP2343159.1 RNA polymerase sigma factor (sigma-70 family) [Actinomadura rupiterrae]